MTRNRMRSPGHAEIIRSDQRPVIPKRPIVIASTRSHLAAAVPPTIILHNQAKQC